jgi:pimeloyl-ACP methyl ester carboxylesterase
VSPWLIAGASCHAGRPDVESAGPGYNRRVLSVHAVLAGDAARPPIVLVHGTANSSAVWPFWQAGLASRGWSSWALDLRGHGRSPCVDLARTTMADYADDVGSLVSELARPPVIVGWSMGGLAALMAAARVGAAAFVGLAPSPPARARDTGVLLRQGTFGPEEYGIVTGDPDAQPTMPDLDGEERRVALASLGEESRCARDDRKAGVVISRLSCPALVVASTGDETFPPVTYADPAVPAESLVVEGASHWGLVLNRRLLATLIPAVLDWISRATRGPASSPAPCGS